MYDRWRLHGESHQRIISTFFMNTSLMSQWRVLCIIRLNIMFETAMYNMISNFVICTLSWENWPAGSWDMVQKVSFIFDQKWFHILRRKGLRASTYQQYCARFYGYLFPATMDTIFDTMTSIWAFSGKNWLKRGLIYAPEAVSWTCVTSDGYWTISTKSNVGS